MKFQNENALAEALQAGDPAAADAFVACFRTRCLAVIATRHVPAADREDVCQEALWSAFEQLARGTFRSRARLWTWLFVITCRRCDAYWRDRFRHTADVHDPRWPREVDHPGRWMPVERAVLVNEILRAQPVRNRRLFLRVGMLGWTVPSAAKRAHVSIRRAYAIVANIHSAVRSAMDERASPRAGTLD